MPFDKGLIKAPNRKNIGGTRKERGDSFNRGGEGEEGERIRGS